MVDRDDQESMRPADGDDTRSTTSNEVRPPWSTRRDTGRNDHYRPRGSRGEEGEETPDRGGCRMDEVNVPLPGRGGLQEDVDTGRTRLMTEGVERQGRTVPRPRWYHVEV